MYGTERENYKLNRYSFDCRRIFMVLVGHLFDLTSEGKLYLEEMPKMSQPKYIMVKNEIKQWILEGKYPVGSKIPSESQIQEKYKVSRHTVRLAISELVNEGYLQKKQGAGTFVSNRFVNGQTNATKTIGLITTYVSEYIFPSIIRGVESELSQEQYSLMLSSTHNNVQREKMSLETMLQQNVDGLIIEPTKSSYLNPNLNYYLQIVQNKIPLLMLHAKYEELDVPVIAMDDVQAGKIATDYLIDLQHEDIAIIIKIDDQQGKKRLKGYINSLNENDLSFENEYLIPYDTESMEQIGEKVTELVQSNKAPTAFICYNDQVAVILIQKLLSLGKNVPDDFSVVSIDNSYLSSTLPSIRLTSVNHPKDEMGKMAAKMILKAIEDNSSVNQSFIFQPELIVGNSTKRLDQ